MKPSEIGEAYDQIVHKWTDEKFNRENGVEAHKRALAFLKEGKSALDAGCGCTGRFFDLLIENGLTPEGIDISEKMVELVSEKYPDLNIHHADICQWQPSRQYDFITAWDSIWHVPLEEKENLIRKLCQALTPGGVFIFSTGGVDAPEFITDDTMGPTVYYSTLGIPKYLEVIADESCICRHLEYDQYPELHLYLIVQKAD
ncbi:MAG: class I SAM-dependent methyltransferase [Neptuniibacter sp.]